LRLKVSCVAAIVFPGTREQHF